jgi:hypothetical protein
MVDLNHVRLNHLIDALRCLTLRPDPGIRYRCDVCGARVGQPCADLFCYGSLGDPPATPPRRRRR